MSKKRRYTMRALKILALVLLLSLVVIISAPWWFNFNHLRGPVADLISGATGRDAAIGEIDLDMGWTPELTVGGIVLGNADWAEHPDMVRIQRLQVSIELRSLLRGRIVLPELAVVAPEIRLTRNAEGQANWVFGAEEPEQAEEPAARRDFPVLRRIRIEDAVVTYQDATRDFRFLAEIDRFQGNAGGDAPLRANAEGRVQEEPFTLDLEAGSMIALRNEDKPYPLELDVAVGETQGTFNGSIDRPLALRGLQIDLRVEGPNLAALYPVLGVPLPATPPYRLSGRLQHRGSVWGFEGFDGRVGGSDLAGDFNVDFGGERLEIVADLTSDTLDFVDLAPIIGVSPDAGETAQEEETEAVAESDRVIPDTAFNLDKLRTADADVQLQAKRVEAPNLPIDDLNLDLQLTDGLLQLSPLQFGVADGTMNAYATIDASNPTITWDFDVRMRNFRLNELLQSAALEDAGSGALSGDIKLEARGNTLHEALAVSDGRMTMVLAGGTFSNLLLELAGLDVAQALGLLVTEDQKVPIRCVIGDFDIEDGVMRSRALVVDTEDTRINGAFRADLETEEFELTLSPNPKDFSVFSARTPVTVSGSFTDVAVAPDYGSLGLRAGAAVALGVVAAPVAALLAFVEPGLGEDANCRGLLQSTEELAPEEDSAG